MLQVKGGIYREYPDNTMPAFIGAVCQGYAAIVVEVKLTRDGQAVALRDREINRTATYPDGSRLEQTVDISDISYEEALQYDFGGWFSNKFRGTKLPLLSEVLEFARQESVQVVIDCGEMICSQVLDAVKESAADAAIVCRRVDEVLAVTQAVPGVGISYHGYVSGEILKTLNTVVPRKRLTVWVTEMDARKKAKLIKRHGLLGVLGINTYAQYDNAVRDLKADIMETDGFVKPVVRRGFRADTHVHSEFSKDSECKIPDICDSARRKGIGLVCITDHCDIYPTSDESQLAQVRKNAVNAIRDARQGPAGLEVLAGVEVAGGGFFPGVANRIAAGEDHDEIIGSVHTVYDVSTARQDYSRMSTTEIVQYVHSYYDAMLRTLQNTQVDTLAHLTYPLRYVNGKYKRDLDWQIFRPKIEEILTFLIHHGIALELNTSCRGGDYDEWLPCEQIIRMYLEMGGYLLTLGSDAHVDAKLGHYFEEATQMLRSLGVRNLYYFKKRYLHQYSIL